MEFEQRKAAALAAITSPSPDKSPKGTIDTPIISLLNTINSHSSYFTTSSCSGRISIFSHPATSSPKGSGKWVFITHEKADPISVLPLVFGSQNRFQDNPFAKNTIEEYPSEINPIEVNPSEKNPNGTNPSEENPNRTNPSEKNPIEENPSEKNPTGKNPSEKNPDGTNPSEKNRNEENPSEKNPSEKNPSEKNPSEKNPNEKNHDEKDHIENSSRKVIQNSNLVFRFEPLIVAIDCVDVVAANKIVSIAIKSGFRESGITSVSKRVIVGIRCSIKLEVPLGDEERVLVSPEYVTWLVEVANEKMEANRKRTDGFLAALLSNGFGEGADDVSIEARVLNHGVDDGRSSSDNRLGSSRTQDIKLDMNQLMIHGEPVEKMYLWGHSTCFLHSMNQEKIIIFGGFGGMGRHARRNDSLLLDPLSGKLEVISSRGSPSPRLGHTCSMVGDLMFLVGGRADPLNVLNDVWVFDLAQSQWKLLECSGCLFPPSHRHAAAVIDAKIYIFGGLIGDIVSSALYVLNTSTLEWNEIPVQGEWPCGRHSHTLVAHESRLFMFGGCNGDKALGDFYSFDTQTCLWKKENAIGRNPCARFSHSMFSYKNFVGILGGCPVTQHYHELSLFDLRDRAWRHVVVNSVGKDLFVRCTVNVIGDDLVIVGGGAACYAFGTKFSEPIKVNLLSLIYLGNKHNEDKVKHGTDMYERVVEKETNEVQILQKQADDLERQVKDSHWVLEVKKEHAKLAKDVLKKLGWLDVGRKVYTRDSGLQICFPVSNEFYSIYKDKKIHSGVFEKLNGFDSKAINGKTVLKDLTCLTAIDLLMSFGAVIIRDEVVKVKKPSSSPLKTMSESISSLLNDKGLSSELLEQLPTRWERLGHIYVLPVSSFKDPAWDSIGDELWPIVAKALGAQRLARQGRVAPTRTRDSTLEILVGDNGWVEHRENGIMYSFDTTKCMFSWGNLSEKLRMARLDCKDEVIVDLFAGIGYFVLPFLVRAHAKLVYACEWNPHAVEALRRNIEANFVNDRCIILEGDNSLMSPKGVADRVCLGLIPTSEGSWVTAVRALRSVGGVLHVHGNVKDTEEGSWTEHVLKSIQEISRSEGYNWEILIEHTERVKWYAPHIRHMVVDIRCKETQIAAG